MLKPIVSMNQMAMNESIATTCCYKWNGYSITGAATVLHGGSLDVKKTYGYYYPGTDAPGAKKLIVSSGWLTVPCVPTGKSNYKFVTSAENLPYKSDGDWYYGYGENAVAITSNKGNIVLDEDSWMFTDPTGYYTEYTVSTKIKHVGATSAHYEWTSGNSWLSDHAAVQYTS